MTPPPPPSPAFQMETMCVGCKSLNRSGLECSPSNCRCNYLLMCVCVGAAQSVCGMVGGCDQARSVCLCVCACVRRYLPGCACSCICCFLWWWAMGWIQRTSVYFIFHKGLKTTTYTRKASYKFPAEKNLLRFNQHAFAGWLVLVWFC